MEIYENTIIYILCPAALMTGGPNSLHQLCYKLRRLKLNAFIYYYYAASSDKNAPKKHPAYECYNNPTVDALEDRAEHIAIVPESAMMMIEEFKFIRKAMWWLSVDFYHSTLRELIKINPDFSYFDILNPSDYYHFCDCVYAKKHLELFSIPQDRIMMLESYLHPFYIKAALNKPKIKKERFVTFNPRKGLAFTQHLLKYCQTDERYAHIRFVPLNGLTQDEIADVYRLCMLHIDFGEFPGREYVPREAVINDCCIITGKRGASKYYEDVPIPEKYKFGSRGEDLPRIAECIDHCLNNYDKCITDFAAYKQFALDLEKTFMREIRENFIFNTAVI